MGNMFHFYYRTILQCIAALNFWESSMWLLNQWNHFLRQGQGSTGIFPLVNLFFGLRASDMCVIIQREFIILGSHHAESLYGSNLVELPDPSPQPKKNSVSWAHIQITSMTKCFKFSGCVNLSTEIIQNNYGLSSSKSLFNRFQKLSIFRINTLYWDVSFRYKYMCNTWSSD